MFPYVQASVNHAPMNPETGHYAELIITGIETRERAWTCSQGLFNAAKHQKVSMTARIEHTGKEFRVRFHAINKSVGRAYIVNKYGTDRSAWPYDPRRKGKQ
jgi:hypothetical protein